MNKYIRLILSLIWFSVIKAQSFQNNTNYILGFFDLCLDKQDKSQHNQLALIKNNIFVSALKPLTNYDYHYFDVCEDDERLQSLLIGLILGDRYYYNFNRSRATSIYQLSVVLFISHLNDQLSCILGDFTRSIANVFPTLFLNNDLSVGQINENELSLFILRSKTLTGEYPILNMINYFKWNYIGIIFLNSTASQTDIYRQLYYELVDKIQDEVCHIKVVVDADDKASYKKLLTDLKNDPSIKIIILIGWINYVVSQSYVIPESLNIFRERKFVNSKIF